jgi:hypothetical protein
LDPSIIEERFLVVTQCLRDEGVEVDDLQFGGRFGANGDGPSAGVGPAGGDEDRNPVGGFEGGGGPRFGNDGPGTGADGPNGEGFDPGDRLLDGLGLDSGDPDVVAAVEACQSAIDAIFTPPSDDAGAQEDS